MTAHELAKARVDLLDTLTDTARHLRLSKLDRAGGEHKFADDHIERALEKLERAYAAQTGGQSVHRKQRRNVA